MPDVSYPTLTPAEAWSRLLDHARQDLTEQTFRTWLEPTEALRFDGNTIIVGAPDQFAAVKAFLDDPDGWSEARGSGRNSASS